MDSIYQKIKNNLNKLQIKNCSILIAISGGIDSMALLFLLLILKNEFHLNLYTAYVNHNLRNKDSIDEEKFITELTKKVSVPLYKYNIPVKFWKELKNQSIEMAARKIRYKFFYEIINLNKIDYIATAHNLNDKIETFFLQLFRGSGLDSLRSIPIKNKKIIRPLLTITRKQIENYTNSQNIPYFHDYTNEQNIYKRNIVRNKLLPVFREIHPNFEKSFSHVFRIINEESIFLNKLTIKYLKKIIIYKSKNLFYLDKIKYSKVPRVIQKNIIKFILKKMKYPALPNNILLNTLSGNKKKYFYNNKNLFSKSCKNYLWFINQKNLKTFNENISINKIPFKYKNNTISISLDKKLNLNPKKSLCFKFDNSFFPLLIRSFNPKDKILINNKNTKSIKKILNEIGIPELIHKHVIVIESNNKKIIGFMIYNFNRISKEFYINNKKKCISVNIINVNI